VALGLGLLTLAFRKSSAGVRYGLWLAASVKFLVPFAALAALGRLAAPAFSAPKLAAPEVVLVRQAAQPFTAIHVAPAVHAPAGVDPALVLLGLWAMGCVAVLLALRARWSRIRAAMESATALAWPAPMPVLASTSLLEPGLVGFRRPVLLVPSTLFDHLTREEIAALVAHETAHMRRRDNLMAAVHMLVEALFWFHPLVWWIGARLIEERERACDEAVVQAGHNRAAYARSLLECCRLYLQSPVACVAGASGSNLKARVRRIMIAPTSPPLPAPTKGMLLAAGVCAFATPVFAGWLTSPEGHEAAARATAVVADLVARNEDAPNLEDDTGPRKALSHPRRAWSRQALTPREGARAELAASPSKQEAASFEPPPTQHIAVIEQGGFIHLAQLEVRQPDRLELHAAAPPAVGGSRGAPTTVDPDLPVCRIETITGSRFVKRVCQTPAEREEDQRRLLAFERRNSLDPSGYSPGTPESSAAEVDR
jgi:beta-lactamase regulating signal transducer with metallopeptidase domain